MYKRNRPHPIDTLASDEGGLIDDLMVGEGLSSTPTMPRTEIDLYCYEVLEPLSPMHFAESGIDRLLNIHQENLFIGYFFLCTPTGAHTAQLQDARSGEVAGDVVVRRGAGYEIVWRRPPSSLKPPTPDIVVTTDLVATLANEIVYRANARIVAAKEQNKRRKVE